MFRGCFKAVSRVFQWYFKVFQGCFKDVQMCFNVALSMLHRCVKVVLGVIEGSFG